MFNTGPCIPESQRGELFAKYAKGSNGRRGFGLYFCRLAVQAQGGTIRVEESARLPTLFVLRLPRLADRFAWLDENRDGFLSKAELEAAHKHR